MRNARESAEYDQFSDEDLKQVRPQVARGFRRFGFIVVLKCPQIRLRRKKKLVDTKFFSRESLNTTKHVEG